jgi:glucose/arabinose dehydrogenase
MSIRMLSAIALTAVLGLAPGSRSSAQTTQTTQPTPTAQPTPMQPPTPAPTLTQPAQPVPPSTLPAPVTAPAAPPTMSDPDLDTAVMMLNRIQALTATSLGETTTKKADNPAASDKPTGTSGRLNGSGTVQVDRATLDEIRALAGQIAAMIPAKRQP